LFVRTWGESAKSQGGKKRRRENDLSTKSFNPVVQRGDAGLETSGKKVGKGRRG